MTNWRRTKLIPFPSVWAKFDGKTIVNGRKRKYWIQDITDEHTEECLNIMSTVFLDDEPLFKYSDFRSDSSAVEEHTNTWRHIMTQRTGLVCLTEDEFRVPRIAAINFTYVSSDGRTGFEIRNELLIKLWNVVGYVIEKGKISQIFGETEYLWSMGLYVLPEYRGDGVGYELLKSREPLCKALGLKVSAAVFSSTISQRLASRVGFNELFSISYEDLEKVDEDFRFPGIEGHSKYIKFMFNIYRCIYNSDLFQK